MAIGTNKVGTNKVGTNKVGTNKVGTNKVGTNKVGTNKVGINKVGGKWSIKYKKSINCAHPKGFSQKQHCKYGRRTRKKIYKKV